MYAVVENICHVNTTLVVLDNSVRKFSPHGSLLLTISCPVIVVRQRPWNLLILLLLNVSKSTSICSTRLLMTVTCPMLLWNPTITAVMLPMPLPMLFPTPLHILLWGITHSPLRLWVLPCSNIHVLPPQSVLVIHQLITLVSPLMRFMTTMLSLSGSWSSWWKKPVLSIWRVQIWGIRQPSGVSHNNFSGRSLHPSLYNCRGMYADSSHSNQFHL